MRRQYFDKRDSLDPALRDCLWFHRLLSEWVAPRQIDLALKAPVSVRVYSDASFEPESCNPARLGFVLLPPGKSDGAVGMSVDVPPCALSLLQPREQQITPCEALLGVVVPHNVGHLLCQQDVIWYIDNQAACQLLMKGSSSHVDLCVIAPLTHLMLAQLGCRVYFEYIESEANPSDGLSRAGLLDEWTLQQGWLLMPAELPPLFYTGFKSLAEAVTLI